VWAGEHFLFVGEAVYKLPKDYPLLGFKAFIRTLVDSDEADRGPEALVPHGTRHFVIYTTSLAPSRWSRLHKNC
jgi:hypothetical protein